MWSGGGIYLFTGRTLSRVADRNTPVPHSPGHFTGFSAPLISGRQVAFLALSRYHRGDLVGIYLSDGRTLGRLVDEKTLIPDSTKTFSDLSLAGISGSNVVFVEGRTGDEYRDDGIYLFNGSTVSRVADYSTPIPDGTGQFTPFVASDPDHYGDRSFGFGLGPRSISGANVVFRGSGSNWQQGIYLFDGSTLSRVADLTTAIPGGTGNFTHFETPQVSGGNVVFAASGSAGQGGIYLFDGTTLSRVADTNTPIPDSTASFQYVNSYQVSGDSLVFFGYWADGKNGQGIYLATLPSARVDNAAVLDITTDGW